MVRGQRSAEARFGKIAMYVDPERVSHRQWGFVKWKV
jgi:hypothetical protein